MRRALKQLESQWALFSGAFSGAAMESVVDELRGEMLPRDGRMLERLVETNQGIYPEDFALQPPALSSLGDPGGMMYSSAPGAGEGRARSRPRSRSVSGWSSSAGRSTHTPDMVHQVRDYSVPLPTNTAADGVTRSRLRQKGALLSNHPVVYRAARSSGYGGSGRHSIIDPQRINYAAVESDYHEPSGGGAAALIDRLAPSFAHVDPSLLEQYVGVINAPLQSFATPYGHGSKPMDVDGLTPLSVRQMREAHHSPHTGGAPPHMPLEQLTPPSGASSRAPEGSSADSSVRRVSGAARRVPVDSEESGGDWAHTGKVASLRGQLQTLRERLRQMDNHVGTIANTGAM